MLAGRETELQTVRALLAQTSARTGAVHVVQIDGPIGIGKTAFISTLASSLDQRVQIARGADLGAHGPFVALRSMIEGLLHDSLEALLDGDSAASLTSRIIEVLGTEPTVLIVDDAQWLDPASEALLVALMHSPRQVPLSLVVVHRPRRTPLPLLTHLRRLGALHDHLTLGPLPAEVARSLVDDLTPAQQASTLETSQGNPLVIRSLSAAFRRDPDRASAFEVLPTAVSSPQSLLRSAVGVEVAALPEQVRAVLRTLAVAGRPLPVPTLAALTGLSPAAVDSAVEALVGDGLLTNDTAEALHPAVRHAVYYDMAAGQRRAAHRRLTDLADLSTFERADHLAPLGDDLTDDDVAALLTAAEIALGSDPAVVIRWLKPVPARLRMERLDVLLARAEVHHGRIADAIARLRPLHEAADHSDRSEADASVLLAQALRMRGSLGEALDVLTDTGVHDHPALLRERIALEILLDRPVDARQLTRLASVGPPADRTAAEAYRTIGLLGAGRVHEARTRFAEVPARLLDLGPTQLRDYLDPLAAAAWSAYVLDDFRSGIALAERGLRVARRHGRGHVTANLGAALAYSLVDAGRLSEADAVAERAVADARRYGSQGVQSMALTAMVQSAQWQRNDALLATRHRQLLAEALPEAGWWRRTALSVRARCSALLGEHPAAVPDTSTPDGTLGYRYADAGLIHVHAGEVPAAIRLLSEGLVVTEAQGSRIQHAMLQTALAEVLAASDPGRARAADRGTRHLLRTADARPPESGAWGLRAARGRCGPADAPHAARAGDRAARVRGTHERADRGPAGHQPSHGRGARLEGAEEARRALPGGRHRPGPRHLARMTRHRARTNGREQRAPRTPLWRSSRGGID